MISAIHDLLSSPIHHLLLGMLGALGLAVYLAVWVVRISEERRDGALAGSQMPALRSYDPVEQRAQLALLGRFAALCSLGVAIALMSGTLATSIAAGAQWQCANACAYGFAYGGELDCVISRAGFPAYHEYSGPAGAVTSSWSLIANAAFWSALLALGSLLGQRLLARSRKIPAARAVRR